MTESRTFASLEDAQAFLDEFFDDKLKRLHFDTTTYDQNALELLFKTVGADRVLFATENPGTGSAIDPSTGRSYDDLKPVIENLPGLTDEDRSALGKLGVRTIVDQVDAMKRLVNEFRDYARLPAAELKPLDLNALIGDVLALYGAEGAGAADIVRELDPQCPPIAGDAQQLRQVVHNLLQNAQDACEAMPARAPRIVIRTEWNAQRQRVRGAHRQVGVVPGDAGVVAAHRHLAVTARPQLDVVVQVEKSIGAVALYLACLRAGAVFLPLNTAYTLAELDYFIGDSEPSLIICDPSVATGVGALAERGVCGAVGGEPAPHLCSSAEQGAAQRFAMLDRALVDKRTFSEILARAEDESRAPGKGKGKSAQ